MFVFIRGSELRSEERRATSVYLLHTFLCLNHWNLDVFSELVSICDRLVLVTIVLEIIHLLDLRFY